MPVVDVYGTCESAIGLTASVYFNAIKPDEQSGKGKMVQRPA